MGYDTTRSDLAIGAPQPANANEKLGKQQKNRSGHACLRDPSYQVFDGDICLNEPLTAGCWDALSAQTPLISGVEVRHTN